MEVINHEKVYQNGENAYYRPSGSKLKITKWEDKAGTKWRILINGKAYFEGYGTYGKSSKEYLLSSGARYTVTFQQWYLLAGWKDKKTISIIFNLDTEAPKTTIVPSIPTTKTIEGWYGASSFEAGDENLKLTASGFSEPGGSGYKSNNWLDHSNTTIISNKITEVTNEGTTETFYQMTDNINNTFAYPYTVKVDTSSPNPVTENVTSEIVPYYHDDSYQLGFKLGWDQVLDNPFTTEEKEGTDYSGVAEYILQYNLDDTYLDGVKNNIKRYDENWDIITEFDSSYTVGLETPSLNGEGEKKITREDIYYPSITVKDVAGNYSEQTNLPPFSVPLPAEILSMQYSNIIQDKPQYKNGIITYPIELEVKFHERAIDELYGLNKLQLFRSLPDGTGRQLVQELVIPKTVNGELNSGLTVVDDYFTYTYNLSLESKEHAHKPYIYELVSEHQFNDQNGSPFTENSGYDPQEKVPNLEIKEDIVFELYKGTIDNPILITRFNIDGDEFDSSGIETGINQFYSNDSVFIRVINNNQDQSSFLDPEGDEIKFNISHDLAGLIESVKSEDLLFPGQIIYLDKTILPPAPVNINNQPEPLAITIIDIESIDDESIPYEYKNTEINLHLQMDDSIDSEFDPVLTHMEPDGYLPVGALGVDTPVNKINNLKLSVEELSDSQSGIKSVEAYSVLAEDFINFGIEEGQDEVNQQFYPNLPFSGPEYSLEQDSENEETYSVDNFTLLDEGSDVNRRYIIVKATDNAGNVRYKHLVLAFDDLAPDVSDQGMTFNRGHHLSEGIIKISAELNESDEGYLYLWESDYIKSESGNSVDVDISSFGANELQNISLTVVDNAGNSSVYPGQFCSYGDVTGAVYNENSTELDENNIHILQWNIAPSASASSYLIERIKSGFETIELLETIDDTVFVYTDTDLEPHGTYNYRLYAKNQLGEYDKDSFIAVSRTLKNNPPNPIKLERPSSGEYTTDKPQFVFYLAEGFNMLDPDGDEVRYKISIKDDEENIFEITDSSFTDEEVGVEWAIDFPTGDDVPITFIHNKEYSWKIDSADIVEGEVSPSETVSTDFETFTVDSQFPTVENLIFGDENPIYHSSNTLEFDVEDSGSGIDEESIKVVCTFDSGIEEMASLQILGDGLYSAILPDGKFQLSVIVEDNAGNKTFNDEYAEVWIDTELPQISGTMEINNQSSGEVITANNSIDISFTAVDSVSGLLSLEYQYKSEENGHEINGTIDISELKPVDDIFSLSIPFAGAVNRTIYSLGLQVVDNAGNKSDNFTNTSLTVMQNLTPPDVDVAIAGGYNAAAGSLYVSDLSDLSVDVDMDVEKSGIISTRYGIHNYETDEVLTWNNSLTSLLNNANLENGTRYSIVTEVANFLGLSNIGYSDIFIFDDSKPVALSLVGISGEPYVDGETFRVQVEAEDTDSTIIEYRLAIGTAENPTLLTENVNGQREGVLVKGTGDGNIFSFAFPENVDTITNGFYTVSLEAVNGSGLVSILIGGILVLDNNQDKIIVSDGELFTSNTDSISGRWRYNGEKEVTTYKYALLKASDNRTPLESEWIYTEDESGTYDFTENPYLIQGETYKFFVQAYFDDESFSSIYSNNGVTVDMTPPDFNSDISTPLYSKSKSLWIDWNCDDQESGIGSIEAIVDRLTYDNSGNIVLTDDEYPQPVYERLAEVDLPSVGSMDKIFINSDRDGAPLNIQTGDHVYLTLRVTNGSGLVVDRVSEVVIIDDSAPPAPLVIDQGDSIKPTESVYSHWLWSENDRESGISGYQWQIYNEADGINPSNWISSPDALELSDAGTYASYGVNDDIIYIAVKAVNGAGIESIGISNGITIDDQAPDMAEVTLVGTTGNEDYRYINRKNNLTLNIDASDNQTGIINTYDWSYGTFDEYAQWLEIQENQTSDSNTISVTLKEEVEDGNVITFNAASIDDAGNKSTGYSKGVMYDSTSPEVLNINGYLSGDVLQFDWDSDYTNAPIEMYHYTLKKLINENTDDFIDVEPESGSTTEKRITIDASDPSFEDNFYILEVVAESAAAKRSGNVNSNIVMVDKSAPVITDFYNNRFTSTKVDFNVTAEEPTSRITEFQYAVGTFEDPNTISGKWINRKTGSNRIDDLFEFRDLPGGNDSVLDGTELLVRVRVKNSAGLWSPVISGIPILVDKTPAQITELEVAKSITIKDHVYDLEKAYTSNSTSIEQILASAVDEQSGVISYQFGVVPASDKSVATVFNWGPIVTVNSVENDILKLFNDQKLSLGGLNLADKDLYAIAMRVYNGSGDSSVISFSNDVTTDLQAPLLSFSTADSTSVDGNMFTELYEDAIRLISNGESVDIAYSIDEETSEKVFVEFDLELPSRDLEHPDSLTLINTTNSTGFYTFDKSDIDGYGNYVVIARLTDAAGNYVHEGAVQRIRLNSPPLITLTDNVTTPGQPLTFRLEESAEDDDGLLSCLWNFGNGLVSSESVVDLDYRHRELRDRESDYDLNITVSDIYGKTAEKSLNMKVLNTSSGNLFIDEFWSGDHIITGTVDVPEGLVLNIADDSNIYAYSTPEDIGNVGLLINGTLNAGNNIYFTVHDDVSELFWKGIHVSGTANIGQSTISRAIRGLTTRGLAEIGLVNTTFTENMIGTHIVEGVIVLSDLFFFDNYEYAIKEDGGAVPFVSGCQFTGNTYDYYDESLTAIDYIKLNDISSNTGNTGN